MSKADYPCRRQAESSIGISDDPDLLIHIPFEKDDEAHPDQAIRRQEQMDGEYLPAPAIFPPRQYDRCHPQLTTLNRLPDAAIHALETVSTANSP